MKSKTVIVLLLLLVVISGCVQEGRSPTSAFSPPPTADAFLWEKQTSTYPKIASWLAKKDEIIASGKPYSLVMSAWFTPEEAAMLKKQNPEVILLAGLSVNWVWDDPEWIKFLLDVAGYGRETQTVISEDMYLHKPDGTRCAFGWASEEWGHGEIYAMDAGNPAWSALIISFYKNVLDQPQHNGIIIDMMLEKSLFPETVTDESWVENTKIILQKIKEVNTLDKPVIINAGRDYSEIDAYAAFMDGYLMENFMGLQLKTSFDEGLKAAEAGLIVIFAVDTDDTGIQDPGKMRLGLILSLLFDNTYFTYDFGPRDHGQAWWFPEYDTDLGKPLGSYYRDRGAYFRDFENGTVIAAPDSDVFVSFEHQVKDTVTGITGTGFTISKGDAGIYLDIE